MAEDGTRSQNDCTSFSTDKSSSFSMEKERYKMEGERLGRAYIFNNESFDEQTGLGKRDGTDKDRNSLKALLEFIGFKNMDIPKDQTQLQAIQILDKISKEDFKDDNCFLAVFLSHGENEKIWMRDGKLDVEDAILTKFRGNRCKSLSGKPKIFIIQACRGTKPEEAVWSHHKGDKTDVDAVNEEVGEKGVRSVTPAGADFVVCYATANGYLSYRNKEDGSRFIQNFVRVMENYFKKSEGELDFLSLMTVVANNVARKIVCGEDGTVHIQMPCTVSTLRKQLFLPKLSNQPEADQVDDQDGPELNPSKA